jgi:hypothetical protein
MKQSFHINNATTVAMALYQTTILENKNLLLTPSQGEQNLLSAPSQREQNSSADDHRQPLIYLVSWKNNFFVFRS